MDQDSPKTVCCRNINIITNYVKRILGSDSLLLKDLPFPEEYLRDEHNWVALEVYCAIMDRAVELLKDQDAPYKMGMSAQELDSWGVFRYLQKVFGSVIFGPIEIYKHVGKYNQFFNRTKDLIVAKEGKNSCYIKVKFKNQINPVDDYVSDSFIRGILTAIPRIWHLPPAEIEEPLYEYDIEYLLRKVGRLDESEFGFYNNVLSVRGKEIGRKVVLLAEENGGEPLYAGNYKEISGDLGRAALGVLITGDFAVNEKLKLKKGQIYNAPYFIYLISWQRLGFFRKIYQLTVQSFLSKRAYREGIETQLATIKNYVETLEDRIQVRTTQLNEAKVAAEFWRAKAENLLHTILPENIVEKMMRGKLLAEEMEGTIVITDLVGFTEFSLSLAPQKVSDLLTEYFTEMSKIIAEHNGWVNKFLGDGILAMFGLLDQENHVEQALLAAVKMQKAMEKYPWKKRIGIATGRFITGEFGTESTRRFDCLGDPVNLASRLQGHAEENEILVCGRTYELIKDKFSFAASKKITPKGVGEIEVFPMKY